MKSNNWQPIETAPHDGTSIILGRMGRVMEGKWFSAGSKPGFYSAAAGSTDISPRRPATHWMPLPAAPEAVA
jgi:hypothetical protein